MNVFERQIGGRRYRIASQSIWDPSLHRSFARQAVLGPSDPPPTADLASARAAGRRRIGDMGALAWAAEQLDLVRLIDRSCGLKRPPEGPTLGEMVVAVALQRACSPAAKCHLPSFLESCLPRISCLPPTAFSGQAFHRLARQVSEEQLEKAQIAIARTAVRRFELETDVLAFDSTNFDTHIATTTPGELARRGHAKSKRSDLRVVGLATLVSETGHVPLLHRTYPGNGSDQAVLAACLGALGKLHEALDEGDPRRRPSNRTLVRDGGFWSEQLELDLDVEGYHTLISLPLSHRASEIALQQAARRGAMKRLTGKLSEVRAARLRIPVGDLDRTLVVVESQELLRGQKRGIAVALRKARQELNKLAARAGAGRIDRATLENRVRKVLQSQYLAEFVVTTIGERNGKVTLDWHVDGERRRRLERTRLGRRVMCTDRHAWSTGRIVNAFRGQWNVEELFRRAKKGGVVPWGPSHQWVDSSLRLHTFATVVGLMLVSLVRIALGTSKSVREMMKQLGEMEATVLRVRTKDRGRRESVLIPPELTAEQRRWAEKLELGRWMPTIVKSVPQVNEQPAA
ncbi:MAG: transposase [Bryobacterales bacterium]|nr:transposase [Bryobacterales bacterium]